jgi:DNA-binding transcriptional MerR regulator
MVISELARQCGLSAHAIRFYERTGIVPPVVARGTVRRYKRHDLDVMQWIARARGVGLSLRDIAGTIAPDPRGRFARYEAGATLVRRVLALRARETELMRALSAVSALRVATEGELRQTATSIDGLVVAVSDTQP